MEDTLGMLHDVGFSPMGTTLSWMIETRLYKDYDNIELGRIYIIELFDAQMVVAQSDNNNYDGYAYMLFIK